MGYGGHQRADGHRRPDRAHRLRPRHRRHRLRAPAPLKAAEAPAQRPIPQSDGSETADDFNGDGHRDLVLGDLVKDQLHTDDAGIGIVYGSPGGLAPGARQLLSPARQAARTKGQLPAVFDAAATCDLDFDGDTTTGVTSVPESLIDGMVP
ncbi:MAG: hypothetical protein JF621_10910 [Streptomyces turgidiscabies]|nr:hypothetical protein [Streptomyces turgidiscabies]